MLPHMSTDQGSGPDAGQPGQVTRLLRDVTSGRPGAEDDFLDLVYAQLRAIAQQRMMGERPGHTLQATALVHEAYLRVIGPHDIPWDDRVQFFRGAAVAMRRLLVEHARSRGRVKRGGDRRRVVLNVLDLADEQDHDHVLALDGAIERLEKVDSQAAEVVRLRFFAGLSVEQTSQVLGASERTVKRDWAFARAWLHQALAGQV
jgi:RNA polymerase sigma factor (TIGR02999 family)